MTNIDPYLTVLPGTNYPRFTAGDIQGLPGFAHKLKWAGGAAGGVAKYLFNHISESGRAALRNYQGADVDLRALEPILVEDLNRILEGPSIYLNYIFSNGLSFHNNVLLPDTRELITKPPAQDNLRLNRQLLEDTFPSELSNMVRLKGFNLDKVTEVFLKGVEIPTNRVVHVSPEELVIRIPAWFPANWPISSTGYLGFTADRFKNVEAFAAKLRPATPLDNVSRYLKALLSDKSLGALIHSSNKDELGACLAADLDWIIKNKSLYESYRFEGIPLREETKRLVEKHATKEEVMRLNQQLLEDAYPMELAKTRRTPAQYMACLKGQGPIPKDLLQDDLAREAITNVIAPLRLVTSLSETPGTPKDALFFMDRARSGGLKALFLFRND